MCLFNYESFLEELRTHENEEKQKVYQKKIQFSDAVRIEDEPFYDYLTDFEIVEYKTPEELEDDFDWNLLLRLVASSFATECSFEFSQIDENEESKPSDFIPVLFIHVFYGNKTITQKVSELWAFQILRLFEIYIEEQINLHTLMLEDENEENAILSERKSKLKIHKKSVNAVKSCKRRKEFLQA